MKTGGHQTARFQVNGNLLFSSKTGLHHGKAKQK